MRAFLRAVRRRNRRPDYVALHSFIAYRDIILAPAIENLATLNMTRLAKADLAVIGRDFRVVKNRFGREGVLDPDQLPALVSVVLDRLVHPDRPLAP